jgi:hypothetical protein
LGSIQEINIPTATFTSINSSICEGNSFDLEISLTGDGPWEIKYSDGTTESGWEVADSSLYTISVLPASTRTYSITAVRTQLEQINGVVYGNPVILTVIPYADIFTVGGGGFFCGIQSVEITLDGSQIGYTYQLLREGSEIIMTRTGTGTDLTFSPISIEGTYSIRAFHTAQPACYVDMAGEAIVTLTESSIIQLTGLVSPEIICEGDAVVIALEISASAPFSLTIAESSPLSTRFFNLSNEDLTSVGGNIYNYIVSEPPTWIDQGNDTPGLSVYTYTLVNFSDSSGCPAIISGEVSVNVFKTPETGPQYHIPNTFGKLASKLTENGRLSKVKNLTGNQKPWYYFYHEKDQV